MSQKVYNGEGNEMGKDIICIPTIRSFKQHAAVCNCGKALQGQQNLVASMSENSMIAGELL